MPADTNQSFTASLEVVVLLLAGVIVPGLQGRLLRNDSIRVDECKAARERCITSVLDQLRFLKVPYDRGTFKDPELLADWLQLHNASRTQVTLRPIDVAAGITMHEGRNPPYTFVG